MKLSQFCLVTLFFTTVQFSVKATDYETTATLQATANASSGPRHIPERDLPVPTAGISPQQQLVIAAPYLSIFNIHPKTLEEWKELVCNASKDAIIEIINLKESLGVTITPTVIGGVKVFIVEPPKLVEKNRHRLLVHVHGGGYVFGPGEAGLREAVLMAGFGGYKIISIDYRMPPDFPYPAALDDTMAVWKEMIKVVDPKNMGIFGTSTGGALTLAMVLRAKNECLPLTSILTAEKRFLRSNS